MKAGPDALMRRAGRPTHPLIRVSAIPSRYVRSALLGAGLAGAYVGAAKIGLNLDVSHGVITPVWAPSGIALAALLILGVRYWPAVAVGAFVANATGEASVAAAAGITVGNTLAAVVGTLLVRRLGFRIALDRVRAVLALVVGGALASTAISATNGVTVVTLAGTREDSFGSAWLLWWFGDAIGVLMVAPALLVLYASRRSRPTRAQLLEALALLASLTAVSAVVFLGGAWRYPYLIFPFLFWAALRFRQTGAAVAALLVGALGTWGAIDGTIPVGADTATGRVQTVQALFALVAVSLLVVGATLAEREAGRVALVQAAARLGEAQALAHIGSWEWDIRRDVVTWSDELYRMFGRALEDGPVTYATYLDYVHPDDRDFVDQAITRAYGDGEPFALEYRVIRADGVERVVASRGRVVLDGGEAVSMVGTGQDVTEQRQADKLREDILSAVSHELRTPLTSVLGFALTLEQRRKELPDEAVEATLAELTRAAQRLERLLADLLDVERLRRGLVVVSKEPTDVLALVEAVVAGCPLDGRHVGISGGPLQAEVDAPKLERIVENLVLNAVRHTPAGSAIRVRLDAEAGDLLLIVEDEGPGVADEFKEAVFETFNRGANMLSVTPGTGIGLSLVARFAALHGGHAWVEDAPGGGASFRVRLPDCVSPVLA
jgi:PAS domain S-box-containing protein